nr:hypothetical protein Q903MT_gene1709 [Picea sitchensis]
MLMVIPRPHNPEVCSRQYNRSISATGKSVYGSGNGSPTFGLPPKNGSATLYSKAASLTRQAGR